MTNFKDVLSKNFDVTVIGAGPAGAMAALQLAKSGASVLLVDKAEHPRFKVCGCCLNAESNLVLEKSGLLKKINELGAIPITRFVLQSRKNIANIEFDGGVVLSRARLDSTIIESAIEAGATFLSKTKGIVEEIGKTKQIIKLISHDNCSIELDTRYTVVADGLGGKSLDKFSSYAANVNKDSRVGAGTVADKFPASLFEPGSIYMTAGEGGYVGMVLLEDGRLDIAAAFDKQFLRKFKNPGDAANTLIANTKLSIFDLAQLHWHGTVPLTQSRPEITTPGLFIVGDSASYAEPFTGQGIAWALSSGYTIANFIAQALKNSRAEVSQNARANPDRTSNEYLAKYLKAQKHQKNVSLRIAHFFRHHIFADATIRLLAHAPILAKPIIWSLKSNMHISTTSKAQR